MNKDFERCCRFLAEMMEKYGPKVMCDILAELRCNSEVQRDDAKEKMSRYKTYAKRLVYRCKKVA